MDRRTSAALFGALATALLINLAVLLTARATDGGVSHDEERMLLITVGTTLAIGVVSIAALVYAKIRR